MDFHLEGFQDLELSTQILISEARKRDIEIEVLDRPSNVIRLSKGEKVELVQQATKTRLDSYITVLVMENKEVTKLVLAEHGLRVPEGRCFSSSKEALDSFEKFSSQDLVIKPLTTNFGTGVSFLKQPFSSSEYKEVVESTFQHDSRILVEHLVSGEEYRFLVIDYKVRGVTQRIPANVIGDGESSIGELVEVKNEDPRRGRNHNRPLEIIEIDEIVLSFLDAQDLSPDSVVELDKQVFLRGNSNVSTGGDSIDRTDDVHEAYLQVAEKAARAVESRVTGVDIMIDNIKDAPHFSNHAIIEMNFNPVLFMHDFPFKGKNREVGKAVLDALGF